MKKKVLIPLFSVLFLIGLSYFYSTYSSTQCSVEAYPSEAENLSLYTSFAGGFSVCLPDGFERDWDVYGTLEHFLEYGSYARFKNEDWGIKFTFTVSDSYSPIPSKPLDFSSYDAYIQSYKNYKEGSPIEWYSGEEFLLKNGEKALVSFGTITHYGSNKISQYAMLTTLHDGEAFGIFVDGLGTHKELILASLLTYLP